MVLDVLSLVVCYVSRGRESRLGEGVQLLLSDQLLSTHPLLRPSCSKPLFPEYLIIGGLRAQADSRQGRLAAHGESWDADATRETSTRGC